MGIGIGRHYWMPGATAPQGPQGETAPQADQRSTDDHRASRPTRYFTRGNLTMVWDRIKPDVRAMVQPISPHDSNIAPPDYRGPDSCQQCHEEKYDHWSGHSHRWMNALANEQTVAGDFSGQATIRYRGGEGHFYRQHGTFIMEYLRDDLHRKYEISQTIGSRFYQYYVGRGLVGPEPPDHDYYREDHVLPFGFWIERRQWVPIVHVADELPDGQRWESIESVRPPDHGYADKEGVSVSRGVFDPTVELALVYKRACNYCHTTFALGDMFVRMPSQMGSTLPQRTLFDLSTYVSRHHPDIWDGSQPPEAFSDEALMEMTGKFIAFDARDKAITLGISCEACHLGCEQHTEQETHVPPFAPVSPLMYVFDDPSKLQLDRTPQNINAICGRCHAGNRPTYAAGIATWNSTEYTDAMRGSCYSAMSCVHCHDPHRPIGPAWARTPDEDDQSCIACHVEYRDPTIRRGHTHHAPATPGDRCMNCHMPHINEGMQDMVRTHTIFSPTQPEMIEANHPNACNLCHLEQPIAWTLRYLNEWYGATYDPASIARNYPLHKEPVGIGWLQSSHPPTRLAAVAAVARQRADWATAAVVAMLDDPYLLGRQFAQISLEELTGRKLDKDFGYWYFMTPSERKPIVEQIRRGLRPATDR
ncbi:MAG: hypothetical protein D6753_04925 [Planctomycetota bacterium]|nr:MAG: hypothetical protein D6753_04925 [Planctomycetota bacterium]